MTLAVVCWRWGNLFGPEYVNRLRNTLERHLHIPHSLFCVTDDPAGIDRRITTVPITEFTNTPRCQRRMKQYDPEFASRLGMRILSIDLDVVIVDDLTPIVDRPEPIVCWKVGYAGVYCGSFVLYDAGAFRGLWRAFSRDPVGYPRQAQPRGVPSDQPMLNYFLRGQQVPYWTEADGFVSWFGRGYERLEHHGMGPHRPELTPGARIVVLGSADKLEMDEGRHDFIRKHWR